MFNKYQFISDLKDFIKSEATNYSDFDQLVNEYLDNKVIYYSDCFDICKVLNLTHFDHEIFGTCKDICQLAWCGLYDLVQDDYSELFEIFESLTDEV
jgi:hypothetical protein